MWGARASSLILALLLALGTVVLGAPQATGASSSVPPGFIGMNFDGPALAPSFNPGAQLRQMSSSGVQRERVVFSWKLAQPYASWSNVPSSQRSAFSNGPDGVPTNFQSTDLLVAGAAERHLSLTPVVLYAPSWDASPKGNHVQPRQDKPFARYLTALVKRYGPGGSFWSSHRTIPRDPVVRWQIWNEPELGYFWDTRPFARSYVALLRVAHEAIKAVDPSASVILAALTNHSWSDLKSIYSVSGARGLFDVVAADPYTRSAKGVVTILTFIRQVMNRYGDAHKPLIATEIGWPAAQGQRTGTQYGFDTTQAKQASRLSQLMPLLASDRSKLGLGGYYYYTWLSSYQRGATSPFVFSGLLRAMGSRHVCAVPAYSVFRQDALSEEGRSTKGPRPHNCPKSR